MTTTRRHGAAPTCPVCGHGLLRHPRRWHERLLSLLWPQRRYRRYACMHALCGWQGLLAGAPPRRPGYQPVRPLDAARSAHGAAKPPAAGRKAPR